MAPTPSTRIQCIIHFVSAVSHCFDINSVILLPLTPTLSACCGVGSWSRLNSCQSVREAVCWLPRHSTSLPRSNLPRPASCSVAEATSSWINAYCRHTIPKKTNTLPSLHSPHLLSPKTPPSRGRTLTTSSLPSWPLAPLPPLAASLHPYWHNGLSLSWHYKWTRVSAYSAAFQKQKERKTSA